MSVSEALDTMRASKGQFDLDLLDVFMDGRGEIESVRSSLA